MTQSALDRAVANATGESVRTVRQRGFSLLLIPTVPRLETPAVRLRLKRGSQPPQALEEAHLVRAA